MSFIVDATRRQQQETVPQEAAGLAYDRVQRRERRIWLVVGTLTATGVVLTLAIMIKWFVLPATNAGGQGQITAAESTSAESTSAESTAAESTAANTPASLPGKLEPLPALDVGDDTTWYQPVESSLLAEPAASLPEPRVPVPLQDAPAEVQNTLLGFEYSSHLYTETSTDRSLSVNGRRMREGELAGEWVLAEITQRGAIWDNGDIMVDVPVLDLWN